MNLISYDSEVINLELVEHIYFCPNDKKASKSNTKRINFWINQEMIKWNFEDEEKYLAVFHRIRAYCFVI